MDESRLTDALRSLAHEVSPTRPVASVVRRAEHRLRRNVAVAAVCSIALVATSLLGLRSLGRTSAVQPIEPAPAPSIPTVVTPSPGPTTLQPSPVTPARGKIVFVRGVDDGAEIYVIGENGSGLRKLITNSLAERSPVWSPDHSRIGFLRAAGGSSSSWEIWVMKADGSDARRIRGSIASVEPPTVAWSSRGDRFAFTTSRTKQEGGIAVVCTDLWMVGVDGQNASRIMRDQGVILGIDWSPDDKRIVYGAEGGGMACPGPSGIFIVNANGSGGVDLGAPQSHSPSWSPDGETVVFSSWRRTCHACGEIWRMAADGSRQRVVFASNQTAPSERDDGHPRWASDGSRIVFMRNDNSIWTANADGSGVRRLADGSQPDW